MITKITIENDNGRLTRTYDWETDTEFEEKGEKIENMIETLQNNESKF